MSEGFLLWIGVEIVVIAVVYVILFCLPSDTWRR
jgi:hypothetical protein